VTLKTIGAIRNILTGDSVELIDGPGVWSLSAGSATVCQCRATLKYADVGVLRITANDNNAVTVSSSAVPIPEAESGWPLRFHVWVYSAQATTATMTLTVTSPGSSSSTNETVSLPAQRWTLISVEQPAATNLVGPGSTVTLAVDFAIVGLGESTFLAWPVACAPLAVTRNWFAAEVWMRLPEYMREAEATPSDPDYPLLRFLDVITVDADRAWEYLADITFVATDEGSDGSARWSSSLVNPDIVPIEWLPWLAHLLGVTLRSPALGYSSWLALQEAADVDSSGQAEWDEWQTAFDGPDGGSVSNWSEIEDAAPTSKSDVENFLRWQVSTAVYGLRSGSRASIVEAAKRVLRGDKWVDVEIRSGGNPWLIKIWTETAETPDVSADGQSSPSVVDIVTPALAAGFRVIHETTTASYVQEEQVGSSIDTEEPVQILTE
jgi:hypothetical protein